MTVFQAQVIWPGKDFDNKHGGEGAKRTSATFLPVGVKDEKENYVKVNSSNPTSQKAKLLKALKKGQTVFLIHSGDYEGSPYFDVAQFKGSGLLPPGDSPTAPSNGSTDKVVNSGDILDEKADMYIAAAVKLMEKCDSIGMLEPDTKMSAEQISMWAASIAKQI